MKNPEGILIIIGGAVDKGTGTDEENSGELKVRFRQLGILHRVVRELMGKSNRIEVITTASQIPEETGEYYIDAFKRLGHADVGVIHIRNREDTLKPEYQERLSVADGILFTGGDQVRLTKILGGTDVLQIIIDRYMKERLVVAGTSAGAMAMSEHMITRGSGAEALIKGTVKMGEGFGFLKKVIIDSHFIKRGRFGRLCQAVANRPYCVGVGLGEDTGLFITRSDHMETIGSGLVTIVEGDHIRYTNIKEIEEGEVITIENLTVHILGRGHSYILSERRMVGDRLDP